MWKGERINVHFKRFSGVNSVVVWCQSHGGDENNSIHTVRKNTEIRRRRRLFFCPLQFVMEKIRQQRSCESGPRLIGVTVRHWFREIIYHIMEIQNQPIPAFRTWRTTFTVLTILLYLLLRICFQLFSLF